MSVSAVMSREPSAPGLATVALVVALAACGGPAEDPTGTAQLTEAADSPSPTASLATVSPSPTEEPTEEPAETADPAAERLHEFAWSIPFSMTAPGTWRPDPVVPSTPSMLSIAAGVDRWIVLHRPDADSVEEALEAWRSRATLALGDPSPTEIGGAPGVVFELRVADDATVDELALFGEATSGSWFIEKDRPNLVWLTLVGDDVVMILTDAPAGAFESWRQTAESAVATIQWSE